MLALRLTEGLIFENFRRRFGKAVPDSVIRKAEFLKKHGLTDTDSEKISLTKNGFLLSNAVICELLANFE